MGLLKGQDLDEDEGRAGDWREGDLRLLVTSGPELLLKFTCIRVVLGLRALGTMRALNFS